MSYSALHTSFKHTVKAAFVPAYWLMLSNDRDCGRNGRSQEICSESSEEYWD